METTIICPNTNNYHNEIYEIPWKYDIDKQALKTENTIKYSSAQKIQVNKSNVPENQ